MMPSWATARHSGLPPTASEIPSCRLEPHFSKKRLALSIQLFECGLGCEISGIERPAAIGLLQVVAEQHGQLGVAGTEGLQRRVHRVAGEQPVEGIAEDAGLPPRPRPAKGIAPGPIHMADHRQRAAAGPGEHLHRQPGHERMRADPARLLEGLLGKLVQLGRAGAVAGEEEGEEEGDQAEQVGVRDEVVAGDLVSPVR
jgi:hypothetical protein